MQEVNQPASMVLRSALTSAFQKPSAHGVKAFASSPCRASRVQGSGFRVQVSGFRVQGSGCRV